MDEAKNQISNLEIRKQNATNQNSKKKKRVQKSEDSVRSLWENFMHTNIRIKAVLAEARNWKPI